MGRRSLGAIVRWSHLRRSVVHRGSSLRLRTRSNEERPFDPPSATGLFRSPKLRTSSVEDCSFDPSSVTDLLRCRCEFRGSLFRPIERDRPVRRPRCEFRGSLLRPIERDRPVRRPRCELRGPSFDPSSATDLFGALVASSEDRRSTHRAGPTCSGALVASSEDRRSIHRARPISSGALATNELRRGSLGRSVESDLFRCPRYDRARRGAPDRTVEPAQPLDRPPSASQEHQPSLIPVWGPARAARGGPVGAQPGTTRNSKPSHPPIPRRAPTGGYPRVKQMPVPRTATSPTAPQSSLPPPAIPPPPHPTPNPHPFETQKADPHGRPHSKKRTPG